MPKAEVGSTKYLNNKLKSKGLQRLRWYCQICEKQCRDHNGFKLHVSSESHTRQALVVGENSTKYINDFSNQFKSDFLQLLRTSHNEKKVNLNHFYQEYISDKEHIHMNATKWPSLTEFGKYLGREGICRVEEGDKGLEVAWIDNSPEALRRQDAIRKKERQDKGDEEREQRLIAQQIERAKQDAEGKEEKEESGEARTLQRDEGDKIKLNFGSKPSLGQQSSATGVGVSMKPADHDESSPSTPLKTNKPKNVFGGSKKGSAGKGPQNTKPTSEAERIMKAELGRKRGLIDSKALGKKKMRL